MQRCIKITHANRRAFALLQKQLNKMKRIWSVLIKHGHITYRTFNHGRNTDVKTKIVSPFRE